MMGDFTGGGRQTSDRAGPKWIKISVRCFKEIWKVGKVGKVGEVGKVGKVGKVGREGLFMPTWSQL